MNDATYRNVDHNLDFFSPRPNQDSELIEQLGFIPGLKEFLILRQVHALEHATVWMLSNFDRAVNCKDLLSLPVEDNEAIGGLSTDRGFYLYGEINPLELRRAVTLALTRLKQGEWNLAIHPRCGTNASVATILTAGMAITAHLLLPREPIEQLLGFGLAAGLANYLAPEIGISVQKYITTAIPFNLKLQNIVKTVDISGRSGYFVGLQWQAFH
ncbi:MAG: DUF6391 domain-containing protein [Pleurocapsa sp.]